MAAPQQELHARPWSREAARLDMAAEEGYGVQGTTSNAPPGSVLSAAARYWQGERRLETRLSLAILSVWATQWTDTASVDLLFTWF